MWWCCRYNLKSDARESLYDCCNQWVEAVGRDRQFMGGATPNLADLVFMKPKTLCCLEIFSLGSVWDPEFYRGSGHTQRCAETHNHWALVLCHEGTSKQTPPHDITLRLENIDVYTI